jgi:hypothetical protein
MERKSTDNSRVPDPRTPGPGNDPANVPQTPQQDATAKPDLSHFETDTKEGSATTTSRKAQLAVQFPECDYKNAVNYHPRNHGTFGYLLSWSGPNNLTLTADLGLVNAFAGDGQTFKDLTTDATTQKKLIKCCGVIEKFMFNGGTIDPIYISAWVSKDNAGKLYGSFKGKEPAMNIELAWYIISCDGAGAGWYEASFVQDFGVAEAFIDSVDDKKQGKPMIAIGHKSKPLTDDIDIRLYHFRFQMRPSPTKPTPLNFAGSAKSSKVLQWQGKPDQ